MVNIDEKSNYISTYMVNIDEKCKKENFCILRWGQPQRKMQKFSFLHFSTFLHYTLLQTFDAFVVQTPGGLTIQYLAVEVK